MPNTYETREAWLTACAARYEGFFAAQGYATPPKIRITCGLPSVGARGGKKQRIGECWSPEASADKTTEIMISPVLDDLMLVVGTLVHELIHAYVGCKAGHKGPFKRVALAAGFEGKMTATKEGPEFRRVAQPIIDALGPYPHAKLDPSASGRKKQGTRLIKCTCPDCGYTVRTTAKWIAVGLPICPVDEIEMLAEGAGESDEEEG